MDWEHPTDEMIAALAIARKQKPHDIGEIAAAELIVMSRDLLMATQARMWAERAPEWVDEPARPLFKETAAFVCRLLDAGYNADHKTWWYMGDLPKDKAYGYIVMLMDMGTMLTKARDTTLHVIAPSWFLFIDIVCGRDWKRKYARLQARINALDVPANHGKR